MKNYLLFLLCCWAAGLCAQEQTNNYQYSVNLAAISDDMLQVDLIVPNSITGEEVIYHFPASVPNTYQIFDFGRFVQDLKAFDKKGKELFVERTDQNSWKIQTDRKLYKISYRIEDTWDSNQPNPVFESAGTGFDAGRFFLINHSACFGFFKGKEKLPFVLKIDRSSTFYPATVLPRVGGDFDTDIYQAENYRELVDAPLMYCAADTASFQINYSTIELVVYSPNQKASAKEIIKKIQPMVAAQTKYLGGVLPVSRYVFMLHLSPDGYLTGNVGALEHAQCTFFFLLEDAADKIAKQVIDQAAHEFFHIIVPIYIHSEEVHNFDFMTPKMSQHLWLYEGVVDYMAQHVQAQYGLITNERFLTVLNDKTRLALGRFNDTFSLTKMSANCMVDPYRKSYNAVFTRGFMVVACMDLQLLSMSKGKYGLIDLVNALANQYGKDIPFKDEELFEKMYEIAEKSEHIDDASPLRSLVEKYIQGTEKINFNEYFAPFGIEFFEQLPVMEISPLGGLDNGVLKSDDQERYYIAKPEKMDEFGKNVIQFQKDDIILEWNGSVFNTKTVYSFLISYKESIKENDSISIKILRKGADGALTPQTLTAKISKINTIKRNQFKLMENPSPEQLRMRTLWLDR